MTLWRLEWLRLWRTQRLLILLAVFGAVGVLGPLTARYLPDLLESLGEEAIGGVPPMTSTDGITQYIGNAVQMGLLAIAFVGAAALAFDAKTEIAVFFRTRASIAEIFIPRLVSVAAASVGAFAFGMAVAYIGTGVLLEWLDVGAVIVGAVLFAVYLVFAVAVIGMMASLVRKVPAVAMLSVGALILLALVGIIGPLAPWLPTQLIGATDELIRGGEFDYWRSIAMTAVVTAALVWSSLRLLGRRET
jgi:ABC-2 type transport system permease protein